MTRCMPLLRILVAGQTFEAPLPEGAVRVGTAPVCDLTLACEGVAAEHLVLEPLGQGGWRLKDLGSGSATRVNGLDVRQVALKPGDVIEVGAARITFDPAGAPEPLAPPAPRAGTPRPDTSRAEAPRPEPRPAVPARPTAAPATPVAALPAAAAVLEAPARTHEPVSLDAPAPRPAPVGRGTSKRLLLTILGLGLVGGVLVALGLLGTGGDGGSARDARDLEAAIAMYKARDVVAARQALADLSARVRTGDVARQAATWLASANAAVGQAQDELSGWVTGALDFDLTAASSREAVFLERHGPAFAAEVKTALERVADEQRRWRALEVSRVSAEVEPLLADGKYREARARWAKARASAPHGVRLDEEASQALAEVDRVASTSAEQLIERAAKAAGLRGPAAGAETLSPALAQFEGTVAHGMLAERLAAYEAAARSATPAPTATGPAAPTPGPQAPTPSVPTTPETPATDAARTALEADAKKHVAERAFARAVEVLDQALAKTAEGGDKARLTAWRADLALARNGLDTLAGAITADPKRFGRFELSDKLFVAPVSADREGVSLSVQGGSTRIRWATMRLDMLTLLAERAAPAPQDALPLAALLHVVGSTDASERMLVRAGEGAPDAQPLFALLARWRGEPLPAEGYVVYEGRYVTPATRERLILEGRIRGGLDRLTTARDAAGRRTAIDELLALGQAAHAPLDTALVQRRDALVAALLADKSLTSGKVRQKLFELLERRRAHALALIEDEAAYPYPNPGKQGQAEVERRVDEVREVWERPFRLVAGMDDGVKAQLDLLIEVDEALARVRPGYKPDLTRLEEEASKAIDMPGYEPAGAAGSTREYSLKVLAFNERVPTSANREERDNVRAVNEYRMMMGRAAVKIEERLVRAARGHSRHMNQNGYFAHEAPAGFPALATPGLRARRQGYGGGVGENIAWGTPSGRDAFRAWFGSSGHHRNMLGRGWTEMGAGRSAPSHWTQLFGALSGRSLNDPDPLPAPAADVAPDPEDTPAAPQGPLAPRVPDEKPPEESGADDGVAPPLKSPR
jgi:uncharacterized protein YkwD